MPDGKDPDDYIRKNGKDALINLLNEKIIIQSFIWNYRLSKIDQTNPYEISKFEKEIKELTYSINDGTLKKYVLEEFLENLKKLTPLISDSFNNKNSRFFQRKNNKTLKETRKLHNRRKDLSKIQIIESSILFLILNNYEIATKKIEELSELTLSSEKNESFKNIIIKFLSECNNEKELNQQINKNFEQTTQEIKENSNIQLILKEKNDQEILDLLNDLIQDFKEQSNLKRIESLEKKLINNLDENSYSELIKLKSQLNRD